MAIKAALVQMNTTENFQRNLEKAEEKIRDAARQGARLVALPETFTHRGPRDKLSWYFEPLSGPTITRMQEMARAESIYLLAGSILEKQGEGLKAFNTSVLIDPSGEILAIYRKLHLFDVDVGGKGRYRESENIEAGREVVTASTDFGRVGLTICYDLRFPELFRRLTFNGAELIFVPSAFTIPTGKAHWEILIRCRAIENQVFILAPAQTGTHYADRASYGHSMIVDPWGRILARATGEETVIYADLDFSVLKNVRENLPSLTHMRPKIFSY